ncbi:somatomedin-B and thrombospondin type-1 domain-containing protein-like, partial [Limulus polyphemus]|uniref:Somatomedin-B and thrombospondin type-1 domain-containing protein-like n=1 Tax=Limulus polyphemus TaxID=6850 RepID=A0ABM1RUQ0_LIMPO
ERLIDGNTLQLRSYLAITSGGSHSNGARPGNSISTTTSIYEARGSCREANLCCPGRDSSCVVQKTPINTIKEDLDDKPCYCDHACMKLGDCCHDFKESCRVIDCEVTDWKPWSKCDVDCGPGMMTRERLIRQEPRNGGKRCPEVVQKRGCLGNKCEAYNQQDNARR